MVGVPGRSQACRNCRNRRIKCDLGKPACQNCAKSGRFCVGYHRPHAFVLSKEMNNDGNGIPPTTNDPQSGLVVHFRWRATQQAAPTAGPLTLLSRVPQHGVAVPIPTSISPCNAYREKIFGLFVDYHAPVIHQFGPALEERNWILQILGLPSLTPGLTSAALAVCSARIGRYHDDAVLARQSLPLYAKSLQQLRQALRTSATHDDEQTLATASSLLLYEVSECPSNTIVGYMSHYDGAMKLLHLRGPHRCKSGLAHSLFQVLRLHTMFQGLRRRSPSFLAEAPWIEIPWDHNKSHFDRLLDMLLELPVLYSQNDLIEDTMSPQDQLAHALRTFQRAQDMETRLASWLTHFENSLNGAVYHSQLTQMPTINKSTELFLVSFRFPAFFVAQNMVYYWMGLLIVHAHLCFTYRRVVTLLNKLAPIRHMLPCTCHDTQTMRYACLRHFSMDLLAALDQRLDWPKTTAYNICQSLEYFLQDDFRDFGPAAVIPALAVVKAYWGLWPGDWTREMAWARDMLVEINARGNYIAQQF